MRVVVEDESNVTPVEAFERVFAFRNDKYVELKKFTVTANMFCPKATFEKVGGFHTGKISEDEEWCQRAVAKGYRIGYAPDAVVDHPARRTWAELVKKLQRLDREYYDLEVRAKGRRLSWLFNTLALPFSAVAHSRNTLLSHDLRTPRQRVDATVILFRQRGWRFVTQLRLLAGLA
jgi:GT2 family glycosyltransferase